MIQLELVKSRIEEMKKTEEYLNSIRTNIQFSGDDLKSIVVTSVQPSEGKSTTSISLSASFAHAGYRTLLIDGDTRNSVMSGSFKATEKIKGLTSFLSGHAELSEVIHTTNVENLMVIPSGQVPPNPTNLLQNKNFTHLMATVRELFDYIIIDSPPIGLVIDSAIIAQKCDASILVVEAGAIKRRFVQRAHEQMEQSGAQFLGIILNKYDATKDSYGYYGAYGAYGQYGNQTKKKGKKSRK